MKRRWAFVAIAGFVLPLTACSDDRPEANLGNPPGLRFSIDEQLPAFADCAEFEARMRTLAAQRMSKRGWDFDDTHTSLELVASDRAGSAASGGAASPVDSALARTVVVGQTVVTMWGDQLRIVDAGRAKPRLLATVGLPGAGDAGLLGMVAVGERLLVVGDADSKIRSPGSGGPPVPEELRPKPDHVVDLTLLDLHDPGKPRVVGSQTLTGRAIGAVRTADTVRLMVTTDPEDRFAYPADLAAARTQVAGATAAQWIPGSVVRDGKGAVVTSGPLMSCDAIRHPVDDSGLDLVSVLSIDPAHDDAFRATAPIGVLASGDQVAGSAQRLFVVTSPGWGTLANPSTSNATPQPSTRPSWVHAFDLAAAGPPRPLGSQLLLGYLPDPRAMSVRASTLRAVTTTVPPWVEQRLGHRLAVTRIESAGGEVAAGPTSTDQGNGRDLKVIRWLDDVVVLAPDALKQARSFPNENAASMIAIGLAGDEVTPLERIDVPQRTADFIPLGDDKLLGVGQRTQADESRGRLDLEAFHLTLKVIDFASAGATISFGQAEEQGRFTWLPERRTLLIPGWSTVGSDCAKGTRCATSPAPLCVPAGGCSRIDSDSEFNGLFGIEIDEKGRLRRVQSIASPGASTEVVRVGDRLALVGAGGVTLLRADDLVPTGNIAFDTEKSVRTRAKLAKVPATGTGRP